MSDFGGPRETNAGRVGTLVGSRIDERIADLRSKDGTVRLNSRKALVALGPTAVPALVELLRDVHRWTRWEAAKTLGEIHAAGSAEALVTALEDPVFDIRWLAAEGLVGLGRTGLIALLKALTAKGTSSIWLRDGAHHVLSRLPRREQTPETLEVRHALELPWTSIEVPRAARLALAALRGVEGSVGRQLRRD